MNIHVLETLLSLSLDIEAFKVTKHSRFLKTITNEKLNGTFSFTVVSLIIPVNIS